MRIAEQAATFRQNAQNAARRTAQPAADTVDAEHSKAASDSRFDEPQEEIVSALRESMAEYAATRKQSVLEASRGLADQSSSSVSAPENPVLPAKLDGSHVDVEPARITGEQPPAEQIGQRAHAAAGASLELADPEKQNASVLNIVRTALSELIGAGHAADKGAYADLAENIRRSLTEIIDRARSSSDGTPQGIAKAVSAAVAESDGSQNRTLNKGLKAAAALYASLVEQTASNTIKAGQVSAEAALMRPDEKVSRIISRARKGGPISSSDLRYASKMRPDQAGLLSQIKSERDGLTSRMRKARSKSEVRMVHLGAIVSAGKTSISTGEADSRINQLNDAKYEYMKTREYRQKPELPPKSLKRKPGEGQGCLHSSPKTCIKSMRSCANQRGGILH